MSIFGKKKKEEEFAGSTHNEPEENDLLEKIENAQVYAEGGTRPDIEDDWEDEYKMYVGKHWDTSKGLRNEKGKKRNFNAQDNFIFPMVENMKAPFATCPEPQITGFEKSDKEDAAGINDLVAYVLYQNKYEEQWDKIIDQSIKYGPVIGAVLWDQHWIGGSGPDRWVGEIWTPFIKKDEFFPDPAILDLEERLQECSYVNLKQRKKLLWFEETWPEKGKYVLETTEGVEENEGEDPKQATLITHFHKGTPEFISKEWEKEFLQKAEEAEAAGFPFKAKDYRDMAEGTLKGVHCAYKAGSILLDYIPYIYDDGLYPFVYKVIYIDEEQPYGMGDIRNVVIPQIIRNKADEIELGAMLGQGLGGGWYKKGAMSDSQRETVLNNMSKANAWIEVNDPHQIIERKAVQIPANMVRYKESKKEVMDIITGNTNIMQGMSPGANVPYASIAELGARADSRMRGKAKVYKRLMKEMVQLIINRMVQFYTNDRKYRIIGEEKISAKVQRETFKALTQIANMPPGTPPEQQMQAMIDLLMFVKSQAQGAMENRTSIFKRDMLVKTWDRETIPNEDGSVTVKKEEFVPEFDINVRIIDERPTDRNYWSKVVLDAIQMGIIGPRAFWQTIIDGKVPNLEDITEELEELQQKKAEAEKAAQQQEQQEEAAKMQVGLKKQQLQNQSVEKQVAMKAMMDLRKAASKDNAK
jgi:hypothetical protein